MKTTEHHKTRHLYASDEASIAEAAAMLRAGLLVAFPTETVYGLGACVFNEAAVHSIFAAKGRPSDNPLIAHCANMSDVERIAHLSEQSCGVIGKRLFAALYEHFCPGPLTFVLPKQSTVPDVVTAGLPTVAVRVPQHPIALRLIEMVGEPLVAPSANRSGYPSPTSAEHVMHDLHGRIAAVLDGGRCEIGIESTVVNVLASPPLVLRPGNISQKALNECSLALHLPAFELADSALSNDDNRAPASPGMKYRHYAPEARVHIVATLAEAEEYITKYLTKEQPISVRVFAHPTFADGQRIFALTEQNLYAEFRAADSAGIRNIIIVAEETLRKHAALMNRIAKAAEVYQG